VGPRKNKDELTSADVRRLNEPAYLKLPRVEALVFCPWVRRIEEDEALVPVLWQHGSERIVLRDLRAGLERVMAEDEGDPRLEVTRARALVLGDWLWRMDQSSALDPLLGDDSAEEKVLWTLEAWLDLLLIFEYHGAIMSAGRTGPESWPGYEALVTAAREQVMIDRDRTNKSP
jgi:hypothetical protein